MWTCGHVEKNLAKNSARGEKMTNMRYEQECIWAKGGGPAELG